MPTKRAMQITSWSISRWTTYNECPLKAKLKFIERREEPKGLALANGIKVHKLAEKAIVENKSKIPPELKRFSKEFIALRKEPDIETELDLAFDVNWDACEPTDWDRAWVRVKLDLLVPPRRGLIDIVDHKTGRPKPIDPPQMELYGLAALLRYPQAKRARARLWYLDYGVIEPKKDLFYHHNEIKAMQQEWNKRVTPMLNDTRFAPRPGNYCTWCHFRKANGGPCKY